MLTGYSYTLARDIRSPTASSIGESYTQGCEFRRASFNLTEIFCWSGNGVAPTASWQPCVCD